MEYNTQRAVMIIPEYGRNIHKMIHYAITIQNRELRNKCALNIIRIMGYLNPHLRDVRDFQHTLWDQLFIMSNFKLDVDSKFKKPSIEDLKFAFKKIHYPKKLKKFRYYGRIIKDMINFTTKCDNKLKKQGLIYVIANTMKKNYLKWNKSTVSDIVIAEDLKVISCHKLSLDINKHPLLNFDNLFINKRKNKHQYYYHGKRKRF